MAAATKLIKASLARAGIEPKVTTYEKNDLWYKSLGMPAKHLEHQLGLTGWCADYLGDNGA